MASTGQQPSSTTPNPGHREMMFCHECRDEWYRDQHGIICPECGSEFTEIIEDDNDPRDATMYGHDHDDDDESVPSLEDAPPMHPLHHHNPWADDDPSDSDISTMRLQPIGPGRFHVSATIHRTVSPAALGQNGNGPNTIAGISSFLANLLQGAQSQTQGQGQGQGAEGQQPGTEGGSPGNARSGPMPDGQPHVHRFTYSAGARLRPRDENGPARIEPVDDINNVLSGLFAAFGPPPPGMGARQGEAGQNQEFDGMPLNPLMGILAAMSGGQHGDFVYSQEALDRIITQLMEQTASSNAPGPAPQEAIDALPRKKVSEEMLGAEGRAECSICMDEVNVGEEVTELPCKHWFHHPCVSAWLHEHDTCPHCRKSTTTHEEDRNSQNTGAASGTRSMDSGADPTLNMPGAFGITGDGTAQHPFIVPGTAPQPTEAATASTATQTHGGASEGSSGGGFGDGLRRGWSPQQ